MKNMRIHQYEQDLKPIFDTIHEISYENQKKVLDGMKSVHLSDTDFAWNTGYGYDDQGREKTEKIFAQCFGKEDALVRPMICSGTHALSLMITGIVSQGDLFLSVTGKPYDTLDETIKEIQRLGVQYVQIDLLEKSQLNLPALRQKLETINDDFKNEKKKSKVIVYMQRSAGYDWRSSLSVAQIDQVSRLVRTFPNKSFASVVMLDNCYGEFTEIKEPDVDVMAGSLIKNPGGGIALAGGYIAGKKELVEKVSYRMTAAGIGREIGCMFGQTRTILQGLFLAPTVVSSAVKGAKLCAHVFHQEGYDVNPDAYGETPSIIQAIKLGSKEKLLEFCRVIQESSPVNSHFMPIPSEMPGYEDPVIMAAGAFVQGSSIELSADAPVKPPYIVYYQGGLTYEHAKIAISSVHHALSKLNY